MCGIFALINYNNGFDYSKRYSYIEKEFMKGKQRGPENSHLEEITDEIWFGFHRLAINGLDEVSNQPIKKNDCILICNGEIYNHKKIENNFEFKMKTNSDCEVIIDLYLKFGFEKMLHIIDGVFSIILYDKKKHKIYVARDPFGVRPLFIGVMNRRGYDHYFGFSSELKQLTFNFDEIKQFTPGTFMILNPKFKTKVIEEEKRYFHLPNLNLYTFPEISKQELYELKIQIAKSFFEAVKKRVWNTDRKIACLLSGGLDSSIVCTVVNYFLKQKYEKDIENMEVMENYKLETYSIGLEDSVDLKYAKKVADWIGSKHTEVKADKMDFLNELDNLVYIIESYDTTTVRASVGNYLVSKYISNNSDAKVIFNGDGADELMGGYLYFHKAPNYIDFDEECKRLLSDIHYYDVLRSDRSISSNGLEARTPFLDKNFVTSYLRIPPDIRMIRNVEKEFFREAINLYWRDVLKMEDDILPKEVLWRTKEAFSDGVSNETKSWFQIIQEWVENKEYLKHLEIKTDNHNKPLTLEQKYYRYLFNNHFGNKYSKIIPYFWMPKWVDAKDASARTLQIYKKIIHDDEENDHHDERVLHDDRHNVASKLDDVV